MLGVRVLDTVAMLGLLLGTLSAPLGIHPSAFAVLVALGLLVGRLLVRRAALVYAPGEATHAVAAYTACILGGIVGAHLVEIFLYDPELLRKEGPGVLLRVWKGSASIGGALGGFGAILLYFRSQGMRAVPYFDALALGIVPAWAVTRIGCAVAHDHPGIRSTSWLAVQFPDGLRLDLGLLDAVVLGVLGAVLWGLARRKRPEGALCGVFAVGYSVARFFLDFLRATDLPNSDRRIHGLTPAQWICPLIALGGLYLLRHGLGAVRDPVPPAPAVGSVAK